MRRKSGFRFLWLLLVVILAFFGAGFYLFSKFTNVNPLSLSFYETTSPVIEWNNPPRGLGGDEITLALKIADTNSGIDEVIVRLFQKEQPIEIFRQTSTDKILKEDTIRISIDAKKLALKEGEISLVASVFDRSLWSNRAESKLDLRVDYTKPRIEVLTPQQNAYLGGVELVFFKIVGKKVSKSGVRFRDKEFPAFAAVGLDPSFKGFPDLYFSFFPIPIDFDQAKDHLQVFAEDDIGNIALGIFNYRVNNRKFTTAQMELNDNFLNAKLSELLPQIKNGKPSGDVGKDFDLINTELRKECENTIQSTLKGPEPLCLWKGSFIRPLAAEPKATFAEKRVYSYKGSTISNSVHMGIDLADVALAKVFAANHGKVVFAGTLGIYGEAIIIDHGCGISSLYGHLSSIQVKVGDEVTSGQLIGQTGATGLAGGDHLHFEIRVGGTPVTPYEWWEPKWISDHVKDKIEFVKKSLVGTPGE